MAIPKRKKDNNLIFNLVRGIQYASKEFRSQFKTNNLIPQSMGLKGKLLG
jgi:hypothetical protein